MADPDQKQADKNRDYALVNLVSNVARILGQQDAILDALRDVRVKLERIEERLAQITSAPGSGRPG
ncbi:MAG: hypothetical protein KDB90_17845 [Planctomycetes bacterium]|nr:hypothetical protein [Planctomycetota bacterium]